MKAPLHVVLCEAREGQTSRNTILDHVASALAEREDVEVTVVPHLYDLTPDGPAMTYLRSLEGDLLVLAAMVPRAAYWVLDANEVRGRMGSTLLTLDENDVSAASAGKQAERTIWCLDIRRHGDALPVLGEVAAIFAEHNGQKVEALEVPDVPVANGRTRVEEITQRRWYPVVDRQVCCNCQECLNFCLFGVFGFDEAEELWVEQPDACRDGCPACSRVCPSGAIMFPDHPDPAVAGDPTAKSQAGQSDLLQLFTATPSPAAVPASRDVAETERRRAQAEQAKAAENAREKNPANDSLDDLVDDIDAMDL